MKITKNQLKNIIREELQREGIFDSIKKFFGGNKKAKDPNEAKRDLYDAVEGLFVAFMMSHMNTGVDQLEAMKKAHADLKTTLSDPSLEGRLEITAPDQAPPDEVSTAPEERPRDDRYTSNQTSDLEYERLWAHQPGAVLRTRYSTSIESRSAQGPIDNVTSTGRSLWTATR